MSSERAASSTAKELRACYGPAMASVEPSSPSPAPPRPKWKDPFVLGFVIGALVLTALPFLQRRFLNAPPPISKLPSWQLSDLRDAGQLTSADLAGKVLLLELVAAPCDPGCIERQQFFGTAAKHTDDLGDRVHLVSVAQPGAEPALATLPPSPRWHLVTGEATALVTALHEGWREWAMTDAGQTEEEFFRLPAVILVDQSGMLRGFWRDDSSGRGNAINAARLLAERGARLGGR